MSQEEAKRPLNSTPLGLKENEKEEGTCPGQASW